MQKISDTTQMYYAMKLMRDGLKSMYQNNPDECKKALADFDDMIEKTVDNFNKIKQEKLNNINIEEGKYYINKDGLKELYIVKKVKNSYVCIRREILTSSFYLDIKSDDEIADEYTEYNGAIFMDEITDEELLKL